MNRAVIEQLLTYGIQFHQTFYYKVTLVDGGLYYKICKDVL